MLKFQLKNFYGPEAVAKAYVACPIDISYDLQADISVVSGWDVWSLTAPSATVHE